MFARNTVIRFDAYGDAVWYLDPETNAYVPMDSTLYRQVNNGS